MSDSAQTHESFICRVTAKHLRRLPLRSRAGTDVGLSEIHFLLRLRVRQRPVLRLGWESVCGDILTCTEVSGHTRACTLIHVDAKDEEANTECVYLRLENQTDKFTLLTHRS